MEIVRATGEDYESVRSFYHSLIDGMRTSPYEIGWEKDIYPAPGFLRESIAAGELYVCLEDGVIVSCMVLNHECNESYGEFDWQTEATADEITVIHALGVHPAFGRKGYGRAMVRKAFEIAAANHQKAIRLDVLKNNDPAKRLYTGMGFKYMASLRMYYEDTGWTDFDLYEYLL